jgi:hypothetical protein
MHALGLRTKAFIAGLVQSRLDSVVRTYYMVLTIISMNQYSHINSFARRFLFLQTHPPLSVSTIQLLYTIKEKGGNLIGKPQMKDFLHTVKKAVDLLGVPSKNNFLM